MMRVRLDLGHSLEIRDLQVAKSLDTVVSPPAIRNVRWRFPASRCLAMWNPRTHLLPMAATVEGLLRTPSLWPAGELWRHPIPGRLLLLNQLHQIMDLACLQKGGRINCAVLRV